jgi:transmembrane sensor
VQAIGTAFAVRRSAVASEILVTEGVVEIWTAGADHRRVRMVAGDRAVISVASDVIEKSHDPSAVDRALAWRFGEFQFAGETLLDAADQFNRYNTRKIIIVGTGLANERIYGVFRLDEPESFANAAGVSLDAVVMAATADKILISKRI